MTITDRHIKLLKASQAVANGESHVMNKGDAEECVELGLVKPSQGYPLTEKGKAILKQNS